MNTYGYPTELSKHCICRRTNTDIEINGDLTKPVWQNAVKSDRFVDMSTGKPTAFDTRAAALWDDEYLYVAFWVQEPDVWATQTERDSFVFRDNDVEIFIAGEDCYYEFEINALGTVFEVLYVWQDAYKRGSRFDVPELDLLSQKVDVLGGEYGSRKHPRGGRWAFREYDLPGMKSAVQVQGTLNKRDDIDEGWTVEVAFPWAGMKWLAGDRPLPPKPDDTWKIDFSRFQIFEDRGNRLNPGWAWNSHDVYDSHIPELFTHVHFSDEAADEK